ncbi:protein ripply1 [Haemorhous mexicanus]|uniref:protein ripply1 n=1 Tax=Haemorhous mexicanus TaxID=30427 RepID=UPI0028BE4CF3|nr:protein ripply1 [Haemorhous mexicanus]
MQAAACCLTAHGLRVPVASACPPPGLEQGARALPLWRPWLPRAQEGPVPRQEEMDAAQARAAEGHGGPSKALAFFQHPVRLLWPKSKAFDHLYSVGEKLLENFPVQATLFFYEDSSSEEEEDEEEEEEREDEEVEATGDVTAGHPRNAGSLGPSGPA